MKTLLLTLSLIACAVVQGQGLHQWKTGDTLYLESYRGQALRLDTPRLSAQYLVVCSDQSDYVQLSLPDSTVTYRGNLDRLMRYWFRHTDSLSREVNRLRKMALCEHDGPISVTSAWCGGFTKCNTATCFACGKTWKTY